MSAHLALSFGYSSIKWISISICWNFNTNIIISLSNFFTYNKSSNSFWCIGLGNNCVGLCLLVISVYCIYGTLKMHQHKCWLTHSVFLLASSVIIPQCIVVSQGTELSKFGTSFLALFWQLCPLSPFSNPDRMKTYVSSKL